MACHGCEQRRVVMRLVYEATKEWTLNPTGPNVGAILVRLRDEAIERGELDAPQRFVPLPTISTKPPGENDGTV